MLKKFKDDIVYSTEPNKVKEDIINNEIATLKPQDQLLKIRLETSGRKGKIVTIVSNFIGTESDLANLAKLLKNKCAVGGTIKSGVIEIQGDQKQKINKLLEAMKYSIKLQ